LHSFAIIAHHRYPNFSIIIASATVLCVAVHLWHDYNKTPHISPSVIFFVEHFYHLLAVFPAAWLIRVFE
jgi:hypothetical protein